MLPAALGLLVAMISLGLALLTVVDAQTKDAGQQPKRDAALNLAETALSGSSFALSRSWPTASDPNLPWTNQATCATQTLTGPGSGLTAGRAATEVAAPALATNVQQIVDQAWGDRPDAPTARWSLHVCDDSGANNLPSTVWSDSGLGNKAFDANGAEQVPANTTSSPPQPAYKRRRLWVRAQATVSGRSRAVAGLVQVVEQPALPAGYATVAGKVSFAAGAGSTIDSVLKSATAGTALKSLFGNANTGVIQGGFTGIRCGLLDALTVTDPNYISCVAGAAGTLIDTPLVSNLGLISSQVKQFGAPTAASSDALDRLRQLALQAGRTADSVPSGGPCFTGNAANPAAGRVTYINKVGDGTGVCTITAPQVIGTLVVANGRVDVQGKGDVAGVIYASQGQATTTDWTVHIARGATVRGGVYVDKGGTLAVDQPAISATAVVDALSNTICGNLPGTLLNLTCSTVLGGLRALAGDDLVNVLLNGGSVPIVNLLGITVNVRIAPLPTATVIGALLPMFASTPPAVVLDTTQTDQVVTYGTAGTVQRSFREVPPRAGG